jgi:hypothetical protein
MNHLLQFITSLFIILFSAQAYSQANDSLYLKYSNRLIHRYGTTLMKGKDKISFQELAKAFAMSDLGLDQYHIAERKKTVARILGYVSMACGIASVSVISSNRSLGIGLLGGQFVTLIMGGSYRLSYQQHLDNAIYIRNKDYLFPGR